MSRTRIKNLPELHHESNGYIDSDDDDEKWEEMEHDTEEVRCLFCVKILKSVEEALEHLKGEHSFDISELQKRHGLDQYLYIKLINYIRKNKPRPEDIINTQKCVWDNDEYLRPDADQDIGWLTFDIESVRSVNNNEKKTVTIPLDEYQEMKNRIEELEQLLQLTRSNFRALLEKDIHEDSSGTAKSEKDGKDEGYFSTYSHFGIHYDMLSDVVRTNSYRRAILENTAIIKNKVVLDVGCGTSILSLFASQAGAKEVYAVDQSEIIYHAMDIAERNEVRNIIFTKGRLEDVPLPVDKVDVIVSEWMGYFLMFEGMLDSVIYARKNYLREGGYLLPNRCNVSIVGYGDETRHREFVCFWEDVYGFDMTCMQRECLREVSVENCQPEHILTDSNVICDLDLMTVQENYSDFDYQFSLTVLKDGSMTSLVGYFDTFFQLPNAVMFSTSPANESTHWKQVVFYFKESMPVQKGEIVQGTFICRRGRKDIRGLNITIKIFDHTFDYMLD